MSDQLRGCVCYCPDFGLYKYSVSDLKEPENSFEYKFDETELENSIASHLQNNDEANAKLMANVTGLARVNPHKYVIFDTADNSLSILTPEDYKKTQKGG